VSKSWVFVLIKQFQGGRQTIIGNERSSHASASGTCPNVEKVIGMVRNDHQLTV
jgi:hypothetical protein